MKKWLLRITLGFVALLLLLYVFVLLRSLLPTHVSDQDLAVNRATLADDANAFNDLQTAVAHLAWPANADMDHISGYLLSDTNWDAELAGQILANNQAALAAWDAAAQRTDLQVPDNSNFTDDQAYLEAWKRLSLVAEVRENLLLHNGQEKEALDQMMNHLQLGLRMENSRGPLLTYMVGFSVKSMALNQILRWVGRTKLPARQLKGYLQQMDLMGDDEGAAVATAFKAEYQGQVGMLAVLRAGRLSPNAGAIYQDANTVMTGWLSWLPTYNRTGTRALLAGASAKLVEATAHRYSEVQLPDYYAARPGPVSLILSGNLAGEIYYYEIMPSENGVLVNKSKGDVQWQATRVTLALRAYQLTHGRLPADLAALTPQFLDDVPADDFDGQPLRYAPDRKIIYSVGKNLKDDGGDDRGLEEPAPSQRHLDIVYHLDF